MQFQGICFVFALTSVPFAFLLFPKIFLNRKFDLLLFIVVSALAISGILLMRYATSKTPILYLFLMCPAYSLILLRVFLYFFRMALHRNPIFPNKSDFSLPWDRLFYFTFMFLSECLPLLLLAYLDRN